MSDPRMIPADEAKNIQTMFSSFGDLSNRERKIRDLAATVVAQAAQIEELERSLRIATPMADKWADHVDEALGDTDG